MGQAKEKPDSGPAKALTRSQLRGRLKRVPVEHPDGGVVYAQEMTAADFRAYQKLLNITVSENGDGVSAIEKDDVTAAAELSVRTMVDESGERLYGDEEVDALLAENGTRFVVKFATESMRLINPGNDGETEDSRADPTKTSS